jgi:dolichyl-phosphate beta-glucosyltransferase
MAEAVVTSRLVVFAWLAVAILVAIALQGALRAPRPEAGPRVIALGVALLLIVPAPIPSRTAPMPEFFARWDQEGMRPDAVVLIAPFFRDGAGADPMLWAAIAGDEPRMPEAYAFVARPTGRAGYGPVPNQLSAIMESIQDTSVDVVARGAVRDLVAGDLRTKGVTDVIVGPMARGRAMIGFFSDLFGRDPEAVDGVWIWRQVDVHGVSPAP